MRKNRFLKKLTFFILLISYSSNFAQQYHPLYKDPYQLKWVDSIYRQMSLDERIGQLFMPYISSKNNAENKAKIKDLIDRLHIGNFFFLKGNPSDEQALNNFIQLNSKYPVITAIDAEWGLAMRLDSTPKFPWNMTLGAIENDSIIYRIGKQIGKQIAEVGFQMNFSPVVDINTNPDNPIIGNRSFGEDKKNVSKKSYMMMKGLQEEGILTTAKHFPGHGDTSQDSHKMLPSIHFDYQRIQDVELYPYKQLFDKGLTGVMIAHLKVPSLEYIGLPTTLSYQVVTRLLQEDLGFKGLIITDAMSMKGVANFVPSGIADLQAFMAGNDVLLGTIKIDLAFQAIKNAYLTGHISEKRLEKSVKKILMAKYWAGLTNWKPANTKKFYPSLQDSLLNQESFENAITLIKNENNILPIKNLTQKIAYVPLGDASHQTFYQYLNKYTQVDKVIINKSEEVQQKLKNYDLIIIGFHKSSDNPWKSYKFKEEEKRILQQIASFKPSILNIFTSPYSLIEIADQLPIKALIISYQNDWYPQQISPQMIFGALSFKGKLPVSISKKYPVNTSIKTKDIKRLSYGFPEQVGMDSKKLKRVDSLMQFMIDTMAAPGGIVLVARHGKVIFEKSYGYHTYDKKRPVKVTDIYDVASVTKVLAATTLMMKLYDMGLFKLDDRLGDLMPLLKGSNKDTITVKRALSHYGGIKTWIPFYLETLNKNKFPLRKYYRKKPSKKFNIKVAENLYLRNDYIHKIWDTIKKVPQYKELKYRYSGLPFYLFKKYVKDNTAKSMDELLDSLFYKPIGAVTVTFNPLKKFPAETIAPTEKDNYFRHQILRGYVHDMGAAMLGGISGNAGLFGNANDLVKLMQMHLNKGYYGGIQYISDSTEVVFNKRYFAQDSIRRGLGWDKPQFKDQPGPTFEEISEKSFGHQGFTGTMVWADPEEEIVYIFLSNRTYPSMTNKLLYKLNIRSEVQRRVYQAIKNPKKNYHYQKGKINPYEFWKPNKNK